MRRGFTLIELILVIALIALVGGLMVVNASAILRGLGEEPVDRILQKAVREARYQAASMKEPAFLSYDSESGKLQVFSGTGQELANYPVSETEEYPEIGFEQILPGQGPDAPGRDETSDIDQVVFRPDRSSTPFQVNISEGSNTFTLRFDPFSAIVIDDSRDP